MKFCQNSAHFLINSYTSTVVGMNFDLLPGSNVNPYTGKEFPSIGKWILTELLVGGGGGGGGGRGVGR